jgi:hypothetical protein
MLQSWVCKISGCRRTDIVPMDPSHYRVEDLYVGSKRAKRKAERGMESGAKDRTWASLLVTLLRGGRSML